MSEVVCVTNREVSIKYYSWRVVFACFVMAMVAWGIGFYGPSIYLVELTKIHGWPTVLVSGATTGYYLLSSFLMIFLNSFLRILGPKLLASIGMLLFACSLGAFGAISEPWELFLVYSIMAVGWAFSSIAGITCIAGPWFSARRGLAISLALNGCSIGGIFVAPLLASTAASQGFAAATAIGAICIAGVALPIVALIVRPPSSAIFPASSPSNGATIEKSEMTRFKAVKCWQFWTIAGPSALALMAQVGFLFHIVAIVEGKLNRIDAVMMVSATAVSALVGRLALGTIIDRLKPRIVGAVCAATQGLALLVLINSQSRLFIYASCVGFGLSVGSLLMVPIVTIQKEMAPASFTLLVGLSSAIAQFAFALGPGLLGALKDASGSYNLPLAICVTLEAASFLFILLGPQFANKEPVIAAN